jgi:hypothetical protein
VPVTLAKCDATLDGNKPLAEKFGVRGYPTLKMYRGGVTEGALDFGGPREADGIVSYLTKQAGAASAKLATAEEAAALAAKEEVVIVRALCACFRVIRGAAAHALTRTLPFFSLPLPYSSGCLLRARMRKPPSLRRRLRCATTTRLLTPPTRRCCPRPPPRAASPRPRP